VKLTSSLRQLEQQRLEQQQEQHQWQQLEQQ